MTILLDIVLDSIPPSKNARTVLDKRTNHLYTSAVARAYMETVMLKVRCGKRESWSEKQEVWMKVEFTCAGGVHEWDVDGALPCLVDAVLLGMLEPESTRTRPPDGWIMWIQAEKRLGVTDTTWVVIGEGEA